MIADTSTTVIQIFGGAGLIAGGYYILKDVVDYKLKISDRVEQRLEKVESALEKCELQCDKLESQCDKFIKILRDNNIIFEI